MGPSFTSSLIIITLAQYTGMWDPLFALCVAA